VATLQRFIVFFILLKRVTFSWMKLCYKFFKRSESYQKIVWSSRAYALCRRGLTGLKPLPKSPEKNYLLIQIRSISCFAVCTKKSLSQSFYNNPLYRLLINWANLWSSLLTTFRRLTCQILGYFFVNMHIKLLSPAAFLSPKCTRYRLAAGLRPDPLGELTALPQIP